MDIEKFMDFDRIRHLEDKYQVDMLCLFGVMASLTVMIIHMVLFIVMDSARSTAADLIIALSDLVIGFIIICTVYAVQRGSKLGWWLYFFLLLILIITTILQFSSSMHIVTLILSVLIFISLLAKPIRRHCNVTFRFERRKNEKAKVP